jgi:hypothetical protein
VRLRAEAPLRCHVCAQPRSGRAGPGWRVSGSARSASPSSLEIATKLAGQKRFSPSPRTPPARCRRSGDCRAVDDPGSAVGVETKPATEAFKLDGANEPGRGEASSASLKYWRTAARSWRRARAGRVAAASDSGDASVHGSTGVHITLDPRRSARLAVPIRLRDLHGIQPTTDFFAKSKECDSVSVWDT